MKLPSRAIRSLVLMALREDAAFHDLTTQTLIPKRLKTKAILLAKQDLVLCGMPLAKEAFRRLDPRLRLQARFSEGAFVRAGTAFAALEGSARALLSAERVALNFLQRLSGIATLTRRYVEAVRGTKAKVLDTRKTTPGLRLLERYAVAVGGGTNHRFDLRAAAMAKDNHLAIAGSVSAALRGLAKLGRKVPVIIEVKNAAELRAALEAGAKRILLDNMTLSQLRRAVGMTRGRAALEASGGVNLRNVRAIAETGVDFISVGALTHSAPAVDISLEIYEVPRRHSRL